MSTPGKLLRSWIHLDPPGVRESDVILRGRSGVAYRNEIKRLATKVSLPSAAILHKGSLPNFEESRLFLFLMVAIRVALSKYASLMHIAPVAGEGGGNFSKKSRPPKRLEDPAIGRTCRLFLH